MSHTSVVLTWAEYCVLGKYDSTCILVHIGQLHLPHLYIVQDDDSDVVFKSLPPPPPCTVTWQQYIRSPEEESVYTYM